MNRPLVGDTNLDQSQLNHLILIQLETHLSCLLKALLCMSCLQFSNFLKYTCFSEQYPKWTDLGNYRFVLFKKINTMNEKSILSVLLFRSAIYLLWTIYNHNCLKTYTTFAYLNNILH